MWQCMGDVRPNSAAGLSVLGLRAASAASFATLYIFFGSPISGIGGLSRDAPLTREMINKAFHDTAVGQTIGISFTPLFHELFDAVCLGGGAIEEAFFDSTDAALRQEWEVGAATLYVVLVTPIMAGLYHSLVHVPKAEVVFKVLRAHICNQRTTKDVFHPERASKARKLCLHPV